MVGAKRFEPQMESYNYLNLGQDAGNRKHCLGTPEAEDGINGAYRPALQNRLLGRDRSRMEEAVDNPER
jgi:hypothetical protein